MKEHINFICKTAFLEIRRISTIRHYLTDDATKTLVVPLVLSRIDYCSSLLAGLPQSLVGKLQSPILCSLSCSPCTSMCSHYSNTQNIFTGCLSEPKLSIRLHASVSMPSAPPPFLISLTFYIFTLLLDLFAPVLTKGDHAFSYFGPSVWNLLPLHI